MLFRADEALQTILNALQAAGMRQDSLIIVTADHGERNTTHGTRRLEDTTIPWIAAGLGVHHAILFIDVNTTDTAATAAWVLGLPTPT